RAGTRPKPTARAGGRAQRMPRRPAGRQMRSATRGRRARQRRGGAGASKWQRRTWRRASPWPFPYYPRWEASGSDFSTMLFREGLVGSILAIASLAVVVAILWDSFEAMISPRRVTRRFRPTRFFYRTTWMLWSFVARRIKPGRRRETFLSLYGPLSMLALFATWVALLIFGFALLHWSLETPLNIPETVADLPIYWYLSGTTFLTLGFGDVAPTGPLGRILAVVEAGLGFGFLAVIIGYLPVLFQAFSRRETTISLLDARAGSPPSATQLLLRLAQARQL